MPSINIKKVFSFSSPRVEEKENPVQPIIAMSEGPQNSAETKYDYTTGYQVLEIVNRGVNMIVDDCARIGYKIVEDTSFKGIVPGMREKTLDALLNKAPNPHMDVNSFRRYLAIDLLLEGNVFIFFDGVHFYHLPSHEVKVVPDKRNFVKGFEYNPTGKLFRPEEVIWIRDNSYKSIYRGTSRLMPAIRSMKLTTKMRSFQDNFFENGAVPGLAIKTPNTLSDNIKRRTLAFWKETYKPASGGKSPVILDSGTEIEVIGNSDFSKLDFQEGIEDVENKILYALGIPKILFNGGNNANIRPNMRLYYLETIVPMLEKFNSAIGRHFGYIISSDTSGISALQPELSEMADFYTSLKNGGIISGNEAREGIGMDRSEDPEMDLIIQPANIAGSAVNPSEGGRPVDNGIDD